MKEVRALPVKPSQLEYLISQSREPRYEQLRVEPLDAGEFELRFVEAVPRRSRCLCWFDAVPRNLRQKHPTAPVPSPGASARVCIKLAKHAPADFDDSRFGLVRLLEVAKGDHILAELLFPGEPSLGFLLVRNSIPPQPGQLGAVFHALQAAVYDSIADLYGGSGASTQKKALDYLYRPRCRTAQPPSIPAGNFRHIVELAMFDSSLAGVNGKELLELCPVPDASRRFVYKLVGGVPDCLLNFHTKVRHKGLLGVSPGFTAGYIAGCRELFRVEYSTPPRELLASRLYSLEGVKPIP